MGAEIIRSRTSTIIGITAVLTLSTAMVATLCWKARVRSLEALNDSLISFSKITEEALISRLGRVELAVAEIAVDASAKSESDYPQLLNRIERFKGSMKEKNGLEFHITDASGNVVISSQASPAQKTRVNVSDREWFVQLRDNPQIKTMLISEPLFGRLLGDWLISCTLPVMKNGVFAGAVIASVPARYFADLREKTLASNHSLFSLSAGKNPRFLLRYPEVAESIGKPLPPNATARLANGTHRATYQTNSPVDKVWRLQSITRIGNYQMTATVGQDLEVYLAPWRRDSLLYLALTVMLDIAGAALLFRYLRSSRQLEEATQEAVEASKIKSAFLARMSHEIRTPMNAIIGLAGLVLDAELQPKIKHDVELIKQSGESLLGLINDILDFSKIEAGKLELEELDFSLGEFFSESRDLMSTVASAKGLTLQFKVDGTLPSRINGDPGRLRQIMTNLISNAIKFTESGTIHVNIEKIREVHDRIELKISVSDSGIGIPTSVLPQLFQPFSQADGSTSRRFGGSGLGLTICKQLTELMGGKIGVQSEVGQGSTFWFTVLFSQAAAPATSPTGAATVTQPQAAARRTARILVAEDNPVNQIVTVKTLEKLGYRADAVANGKEAVEALLRLPYDLVLMDCHMPEMDGYEATIEIRKNEKDGMRIPIVALTANAIKEDLERCLQVGMDDYATKPIRRDLLEQMIQKWLAKSQGVKHAS